MKLANRIAVVTGVSKGIGKAICKELLDKGVKVFGLGRTAPDFKHSNLHFFATDIRKFEEVQTAFHQIFSITSNKIDILINNAGLGYFAFIEDYTLEQWHQMYETNVHGIFYTCKLAVPKMKEAQYGHIVNIASTAGVEAYPQVSGYCGTKFAVRAISESMYKEMRDDRIKVTCVYPGSVQTEFFKNSNIVAHEYMLQPEDVAHMIVQALETPDNFHQVNLEVRPLQPKGPKKA
jgi:NADP-dependent 3-hydroxy acid dehydrogenase YdfG